VFDLQALRYNCKRLHVVTHGMLAGLILDLPIRRHAPANGVSAVHEIARAYDSAPIDGGGGGGDGARPGDGATPSASDDGADAPTSHDASSSHYATTSHDGPACGPKPTDDANDGANANDGASANDGGASLWPFSWACSAWQPPRVQVPGPLPQVRSYRHRRAAARGPVRQAMPSQPPQQRGF